MVRGEPEPIGMVPETCDSKRLRIGNEQTQHPYTFRAVPMARFLAAKADGDELGQRNGPRSGHPSPRSVRQSSNRLRR